MAYLTLTPAGVFRAFSQKEPTPQAQAMQSILNDSRSISKADWLEMFSYEELAEIMQAGWVEEISVPLVAPAMALDEFLPYVVASLSGNRKAAIASNEGFCLAKIGYTQEEAERLSVAAADFFDFVMRQEQRGLSIAGRALSLFGEVDLLMPEVSFVFLWIDGTGYVLIASDEPLTNNQAFVQLIWAIKTSRLRFEHKKAPN